MKYSIDLFFFKKIKEKSLKGQTFIILCMQSICNKLVKRYLGILVVVTMIIDSVVGGGGRERSTV